MKRTKTRRIRKQQAMNRETNTELCSERKMREKCNREITRTLLSAWMY